MILTLSTTHRPATDLGYLLHKHPDRVHTAALPFGTATVLYPEAGDDRCTAGLIVDVDPVGLARNRRRHGPDSFSLGQYVNDRPYAASSFLAVAIGAVFGTALAGRSKERSALVTQPMPLEADLPVVACRGGADLAARLFAPLGYEVHARPIPTDPVVPEWGDSPYVTLRLSGVTTLQRLLEHLVVLLPVLDDAKHYWVGADEVDKLARRGAAWLPGHPERELITTRYLRHDRELTSEALTRLVGDDAPTEGPEPADPEAPNLNRQRLEKVTAVIAESGATSVVDLGCG